MVDGHISRGSNVWLRMSFVVDDQVLRGFQCMAELIFCGG